MVTFTVQLKPDIPAGTVIMNQAVVHFASVPEDTATNPVVNVVQPLSALPQQVETTYMQPVAITLEGEDPGGPLTYSVERQPFYGELSGSAPNLVYTPAEDFTGQDLFTFQVSDALTTSRPADVEIIVLPSAADSKPPTVLWTDPVSGTAEVTVYPRPVLTDTLGPAYLPYVSARFSEQISQTNLTTATFLLQDRQGYLINSSVSFNPQTYQGILAPRQPLTPFNWYTATLTTGITDLIGNPLLQEYVWRFFALPQNTLFLPVVRR